MSDVTIYDKAKYHYDNDFPEDLPREQAFVHTGMYLGWIIEHKLYDPDYFEEIEDKLKAFKNKKVTGTEIYRYLGGAFIDDMLNNIGNEFSQFYFDFQTGNYISDYEAILCADLPSAYHVEDNWKNYNKIKKVIDKRFIEWKKNKKKTK